MSNIDKKMSSKKFHFNPSDRLIAGFVWYTWTIAGANEYIDPPVSSAELYDVNVEIIFSNYTQCGHLATGCHNLTDGVLETMSRYFSCTEFAYKLILFSCDQAIIDALRKSPEWPSQIDLRYMCPQKHEDFALIIKRMIYKKKNKFDWICAEIHKSIADLVADLICQGSC